jgi:hypothetical protein
MDDGRRLINFARSAVHRGGLALIALLAVAFAPVEATAQWAWTSGSSSGAWPFGGGWSNSQPAQRTVAPVSRAAQPLAYADPNPARRASPFLATSPVQIPPAEPTTAYCVRLCDGRFFPLSPAAAHATPAKLCSALCPASRTKVFEGASIEAATTADGARYETLSTAYLFRKELVQSCTCNGKTALGLAKIDIAADPTLQAGDIVATAQGLKVFNGAPGARHRAASFVSLKKSALVSSDIRRKLRSLRVAKEFKAPERRL